MNPPKTLNKKKPKKGGPSKRSSQPLALSQISFGNPLHARRLNALPYKHRCTLRYYDDVDLGGTGVSPTSYIFSANGLYDPDITGTGHQPMGFDQLMALYAHYTVNRSSIKVQFRASTTATALRAAVAVNRGQAALSVFSRVIEEGNVDFGVISAVSGAGGPVPQWFVNAVNVADFQSITNILDDDTLKGNAGANPGTAISYTLYLAADSTITDHTLASVMIEYDATFTEPLQIIQS